MLRHLVVRAFEGVHRHDEGVRLDPGGDAGVTGSDEPGVTWAVPLTVQVHPRIFDIPDTVKSTVDSCAAAGAPCRSSRPAETSIT